MSHRETLQIDIPSADSDVIETGLPDSLALVMLVCEFEQLTGELPAITRRLRVFPDYDREFAGWLLAETGGGVTVPGALRARLVRDEQVRALP